MSDTDNIDPQESTALHNAIPQSEQNDAAEAVAQRKAERKDARRWWIKLCVQPALFLAVGALLIVVLGVAQQFGWIPAGDGSDTSRASTGGNNVRYICPMMCTPPQAEPGRCPVCAMELVSATSGGGNTNSNSIQIDPVARRVANIRTVQVKAVSASRTIRAVGELSFDEGALKTISAYVDGRIEKLLADYTGMRVARGDHLALLYSPDLYTCQVELLQTRRSLEAARSSSTQGMLDSRQRLYQSSRNRLVELGMTAQQVAEVEQLGQANSRMHLCAPIAGTVIEKLAVEGQYVKEGQPIYRLADLSTVWLMLELFPEDAAFIRSGQEVEAVVQSLPGQKFHGRVAFIDPHVDPRTRTVGVRVVIENHDGQLRIGDYAKAAIQVPVSTATDKGMGNSALVVPRDAVLMAGDNSVLYVETEPGRFELRRVVLGPCCGDQIVILSGVNEGEQVATRGNFLIDSQMQLAGNPSLIDPMKAQPKAKEEMSPEVIAALAQLSPEDRALVEKQRICPVADYQLGSMGIPRKVEVNGTPVFICCEGCRASLLEEPAKYLAKLSANSDSQDSQGSLPQMNLPPIGPLQIIEPHTNLPPIGVPQIIEPQDELPHIEAPTAVLNSNENGFRPASTRTERGFESPRDVRQSGRPVIPPNQSGPRNNAYSREAIR